ncbi:hypothetical protein Ndes2437A_g00231 [Nannochloris sp. 'desiccata']
MHPPLHISRHPHCKEVIEALIKCHNDHPIAKFVGVCNDQKWALDRCFREEKKINRKKNQEKAKEERKRFLARIAAKEAAKQKEQEKVIK